MKKLVLITLFLMGGIQSVFANTQEELSATAHSGMKGVSEIFYLYRNLVNDIASRYDQSGITMDFAEFRQKFTAGKVPADWQAALEAGLKEFDTEIRNYLQGPQLTRAYERRKTIYEGKLRSLRRQDPVLYEGMLSSQPIAPIMLYEEGLAKWLQDRKSVVN